MKRTNLKRVSKKQAKRLREYRKLKEKMLHGWVFCEFPGCGKRAFQVHHVHGRYGSNLLNTATWMMVCLEHHRWIHEHPNESRMKGYLKF